MSTEIGVLSEAQKAARNAAEWRATLRELRLAQAATTRSVYLTVTVGDGDHDCGHDGDPECGSAKINGFPCTEIEADAENSDEFLVRLLALLVEQAEDGVRGNEAWLRAEGFDVEVVVKEYLDNKAREFARKEQARQHVLQLADKVEPHGYTVAYLLPRCDICRNRIAVASLLYHSQENKWRYQNKNGIFSEPLDAIGEFIDIALDDLGIDSAT